MAKQKKTKANKKQTKPMDPKVMDGPVVDWTVADLTKFNNLAFMSYHVSSAGWYYMAPIGALIGGACYGLGYRPLPNLAKMMGTGGVIGGVIGGTTGVGLMQVISMNNEGRIPWNEEGIQQRIDGLSHNFKVRVLDKSVWIGVGLAAGVLVLSGGPKNLGLSPGALGVMQGLTLGSSVGTLTGIGCIISNDMKAKAMDAATL